MPKLRTKIKWVVMAFFLLQPPISGLAEQTYPSPFSEQALNQLSSELEQFFKKQELVGAGFGLATSSGPFFLQGYGFADREHGLPVDPNSTLFRWGAIGNTLTALIAVMLSESGKIDLDRPINRYLKDYKIPNEVLFNLCRRKSCAEPLPKRAKKITLRMLLSHVAGIQHINDGVSRPEPPIQKINNPKTNRGIAWILPFFAHNPLVSLPGHRFNYSKYGYILAGAVMEQAASLRYSELLKKYVSIPAHLKSLQPDYGWIDLPQRATGYVRQADKKIVPSPHPHSDISWQLPSAGTVSTLFDLTSYCSTLLNDGKLIKNRAARKQLWRRHYPKISGYGLGFRVGHWKNRKQVMHDGAQHKVRSLLTIYPDDNLCFVFVTNSEYASSKTTQYFMNTHIDELLSSPTNASPNASEKTSVKLMN